MNTKKLFFFAIAALGLAACSNDEVVEMNENNAITFRTLANGMTRAADITNAADISTINVYATKASTPATVYFANEVFTGPTTYTSTAKHYWPSYNLDFYAWSANSVTNGDARSQVSPSAYNSYVVTPSTTASEQADFIYASVSNVAQASSTTGVALAFTHKESRILVKVMNTAADLSFEVTGWKLGFMVPNGTWNGSAWTSLGTATASTIYTSDFTTSAQTINYHASNTTALTGSQIMIPQSITAPIAYASTDADAKITGPFIGIEYKATNTTAGEVMQNKIWGIWPIPTIAAGWEAGKQYTYIIDLADGGYFETNQGSTDENFDPIFGGKLIKFVSLTITDWVTDLNSNSTADDDINVPM